MPIYEYLCEGCGMITELMQKMSDRPPRTCPECGSRRIAKLVSRSAFQLKGGGWYADLYSSPKPDTKPAVAATPPAKGAPPAAKPAAPVTAPAPAANTPGTKKAGGDAG